MTAGPWILVNSARTDMLNGTFNFASDSFKVALFTSSSNLGAGEQTYASLTGEVGTTNTGYTTGGQAVTLTLTGTTSVVVAFQTDPTWTAGTANLTAKMGCLYEVGGDVVAYFLLDSGGADVTTTSGQTLTVDSDGSPGPVFTLA